MTFAKAALLRATALSAALLVTPQLASAQTANETAATDAAQGDMAAQSATGEEVIVTGSARRQRRFDVSYAVNSLGQDDVKRLAPLNFADLLGKLPGIQVEATGGEVQNVTRIRGIPTDDGYAVFQQDGLPLFQSIAETLVGA